MGIFYGSRKVTLRFNSGGEELARAVLGVPSVDCSSISIIALGQKAEEKETSVRFLENFNIHQCLRPYNFDNVEVLSVEDQAGENEVVFYVCKSSTSGRKFIR